MVSLCTPATAADIHFGRAAPAAAPTWPVTTVVSADQDGRATSVEAWKIVAAAAVIMMHSSGTNIVPVPCPSLPSV